MTSSQSDTFYGETVPGQEFNIGQIFSVLFTVGFFSLICPTWIVARFCMKKHELIEEEDEIPYEKRYQFDPKEYSGNKENLERNILLEKTPQGCVCMRYSDEEEAFEYWSDAAVNFNILETVGRKYVKTFKCSDIFIDREKELEKKIGEIKEEIEVNKKKMEEGVEEEEEEEEEEDSVFLRSKKSRDKKKLKVKLTADDRTIEKSNKYIRKGRFCEANWFMVEKPKDKKKEMSFTEWLLSSKKNKKV